MTANGLRMATDGLLTGALIDSRLTRGSSWIRMQAPERSCLAPAM